MTNLITEGDARNFGRIFSCPLQSASIPPLPPRLVATESKSDALTLFRPSSGFFVFRVKSVDFEIPSHVSPLARDLIRSLLRKSPADRLPLDRVLTHPFFSENCGKDNAFSLSRSQSGKTVPSGSLSSSQPTLGSDGSSGKGSQVALRERESS